MLLELKGRLDSNLRVVLTGGVLLAGLQVANAGLAYAVQLVLARWMSVAHYGWYAFGWAIATLVAIPAALGLPHASLRFIPEYLAKSDQASLDGFVRWSRVAVVAAGTGIAVVSVGAMELFHALSPGPRQTHVYVAFAVVPLLALSNLHVRQSHSFGWPTRGYLPQVVLTHLGLLVVVGVAVTSGWPLNAQSVLSAVLVLYALTVVVQRMLLDRGRVVGRHFRRERRLWLRVALPLLISGAAYIVLERMDLIMIGLIMGPEDVAVYNAAAKTALLVSIVLTGVGSMATPRFASLFAEGKMVELRALVAGVIRWSLLPSLVLFAFLVVAGRSLLGFFGEEYTAGYPFLIILAAVQSLSGLVGLAGHLLNVTGHETITAWGLSAAAVVNLLLNAILIPLYGLWGAAVATALSLSAWNILLPVLAFRYSGVYSTASTRVSPSKAMGREDDG